MSLEKLVVMAVILALCAVDIAGAAAPLRATPARQVPAAALSEKPADGHMDW